MRVTHRHYQEVRSAIRLADEVRAHRHAIGIGVLDAVFGRQRLRADAVTGEEPHADARAGRGEGFLPAQRGVDFLARVLPAPTRP